MKKWQNKENGDSNGKRVKPAYLKNFWKNHQRKNFNKTGENQEAQSEAGSKLMDVNNNKYGTVKMKEPLNFCGCENPHLLWDFPHGTVQNIQLL